MFSGAHELKRIDHLVRVLIKHKAYRALSAINHPFFRKHAAQKTQKHHSFTPEQLVSILQDCSGAFLKLGQFLSLRPDLIPHEYSRALEQLQDHVPPFPNEQAHHIIQTELSRPLDQLFTHIDPQPLASGSIGQVYRALLSSNRHVAVKVARPNIRADMTADILLFYKLAHLLEHHIRVVDPIRIVDEFRRYTLEELDYTNEANNLLFFNKHYAHHPHVLTPTPLPKLCSERVLTMDYLNGKPLSTKIHTLHNNSKKELAKLITQTLVKQVFTLGVYHADPHPGNIVLLTKKRIGLLDFGIVGRMSEHERALLVDLMMSFVNNDSQAAVICFKALGVTHAKGTDELFTREFSQLLQRVHNEELSHIDIVSLFNQTLNLARTHRMNIPANLVLLGKTIITLKGVVEELDPEFNITNELKAHIARHYTRTFSPKNLLKKGTQQLRELEQLPRTAKAYAQNYLETQQHIEQQLSSINKDLKSITTNVQLVTKELFIFITAIVFFAGVMVLWDKGPTVIGLPVISTALLLLSLYMFIRVIHDTLHTH